MQKISFQDLALSADVQQAIVDMGFTEASPIQSQAIPHLLEGRDVLGQAQTGTGKTAAFAIPALERLETNQKKPQVLVLCPTRELALQVSEEFKKLAKYKRDVFILAVYGGESIDRQIKFLQKGVQIVIGTPGRIMDHLERGTLQLDNIRTVVLDEADEMLNMGFIDDIQSILSKMPEERQTVLFSATVPDQIRQITKRFQRNPEFVKVVSEQLTNATIEQFFFPVREEDKTEVMHRLIEMNDLKLMLAFCNTKQRVDELVESLQAKGYSAEGLHGDLRQMQRNAVMSRFRKGLVNILVATDVAARGIDVDNVEAVFNFDTPLDPEYYVHRIGRTGRAGRKGISYTFVLRREVGRLRDIERFSKVKIDQGVVPSPRMMHQKRQERFKEQLLAKLVENQSTEGKFDALLNEMQEQGFDYKQIAEALLLQQIGDEKQGAHVEAVDINRKDRDRETTSSKGDRFGKNNRFGDRDRNSDRNSGNRDRNSGNRDRNTNDFGGGKKKFSTEQRGAITRLFINLGKDQKVSKADILGAIAGETGLSGHKIGMIDIYDQHSFVDVPAGEAQHVISTMNKSTIKGKKVNLTLVN
ncbi:MAG: DEAD/DEAH box helicase [Bacteroidetes bacterium]|nr:MAG: DEAD/DEAH box helicase [Bacteroidota bacterium]